MNPIFSCLFFQLSFYFICSFRLHFLSLSLNYLEKNYRFIWSFNVFSSIIHYNSTFFFPCFLSKKVTKSPNISKKHYHKFLLQSPLPPHSSSFCSIFWTERALQCKQVTFLFLFHHKLYNGYDNDLSCVRIVKTVILLPIVCYYSSWDISNVNCCITITVVQ